MFLEDSSFSSDHESDYYSDSDNIPNRAKSIPRKSIFIRKHQGERNKIQQIKSLSSKITTLDFSIFALAMFGILTALIEADVFFVNLLLITYRKMITK